jgi:serine O-acetyltransferase
MRPKKLIKLFYDVTVQPIIKTLNNEKRFKIDTSFCDIHTLCNIPSSTKFIHKGLGVVIGAFVKLGENVTIYHNVTIGGSEKYLLNPEYDGDASPTIQDNVIIMTGSVIIGDITIGHDSIIGAGSIVIDDIPPYSLVVGVPGRVIQKLSKKI